MRKKRKIEYKKIALAFIVLFAVIYISIGRLVELCGVMIDTDVDTALVYAVFGSFASYCIASASDKYGMNKFGQGSKINVDYKQEDGTE